MLVSLDVLKEVLSYDRYTGVFIWKKDVGKRIKVGSRAGSADSGYRTIKLKGKKYREHRLAWFYVYGEWPTELIDHIDGDGLNNKFDNLRLASRQQNNCNKSTYSNNTSGVKGVSWSEIRGLWKARIKVDGKEIHVGYFLDICDAEVAVKEAREKYHGEFHSHR